MEHQSEPAGIARAVYAQSRRTPGAVAVVDGDLRLDYATVDALAHSVRLALQRSGIRPGDTVAVTLPRSWQLVVVMLGALRLGARVVPLDGQSPPNRQRHILTDSAAVALVCDDTPPGAQAVPDGLRLVPVATILGAGPPPTATAPTAAPPDSPAPASFLFYTSGTTGTPKGVQVRDAGVLRMAEPGYLEIPAQARFSWMSNTAFDALSFEVWTPLVTGGCCVVVPDEIASAPDLLARFVSRERIDILFITTALFNVVADAVPGCFADVGHLLVGGEQLSAAVIRRWYDHNAGSRTVLYNVYGPTESSTFAICGAIPRDFAGQTIPIGRPIPKTTALLVVPAEERLAEVGEVGELLLGGDGLAAGYQNLPDETSKRFVNLPWHDGGHERFYRTGDLVRADADGLITFLGRADRQVKVRGFRIELDEIERRLEAHRAVRQALVCTRRDDEHGPNQLLAYLLVEPGLSVDEFEAHLADALPVYMRPHQLYVVDEFPLTANGKIDQAALLRNDIRPWRRATDDAALSTSQRDVLDLASQILGMRPALNDRWMTVGGDSLKALQFRFAVQRRWACDLPQSSVLQGDFAQITERIGTAREIGGGDYPALRAPAGAFSAPATSEQQRLWLFQQKHPRSRAYDVDLAFRIDGPVDAARLRRALRAVVERHPALRTGFTATPAGLRQVVGAPYDPWVEPDDTMRADPPHHEAFSEPFDVARPQMLWACWLPDADGGRLLLRLHHIAVDGWSLGILFGDLSAAYAGTLARESPEAFTMLDYPRWQAEWFARPRYLAHRDDLRALLAGREDGSEEQLPEPASMTAAGLLHRPLDTTHRAILDRLCVDLRLTRFELLLAVFGWSLYAVTGHSRPRIAAPVANRALREFENTVGMFANTVLLPVEVLPGENIGEQIAPIAEGIRSILDHQEVAFADILSDRPAHGRPFDYLFVLENTDFSALRLPDCTTRPLWPTPAEAKTPLTVSVLEDGAELQLLCEYSQDHLTHDQVSALADVILDSLIRLDQGPATTPDALAAQYRGAMPDPGRGESVPLTYHTIAEGFARQVLLTPAAPALRSAAGTVTYAELDAQAAALAERLRAGYPAVEEDQPCRIAVYFQPSVEHVVALLALARLNVTAVPLDREYPPASLRRVLAEAAPLCVLLGPGCESDFERLGMSDVAAVPVTPVCVDAAVNAVPRPARDTRPLYMLFTSGSTGTPKGVEVFDRVLCNLVQWQQRSGGLTEPAVTQQFSMLSFDVSFQEIFGTLCTGGCLQLLEPAWRHDVPALLEHMDSVGVQRIFLPYVALQLVAEHGVRLGIHPARLREVVTAGEQLICTPAIRRWIAGLPGARLFNHYGPTETHVVSSLCLAGDPDDWPQRPAIGRPVANSLLRVVDASGRQTAPGVDGELLIGGPMVTRCYPNAPDLNASRFVESPELFYRSGDRAYFDREGLLHFVGRHDQQIKLSGYRLDLEHVEAVLLQHPQVAQAAVVVDADRLVAYLRCGEPTPTFEDLTHHLQQSMPAHVRVHRFRELAQFPLTPSGKVNRAALPDAAGADLAPRAVTRSAAVGLEARLARIFHAVIGSPIGPDQTFFEAGASSLGLMRFQLRCAGEVGLPFSVADLFEHTTIGELVRHLEKGVDAQRDRAPREAVDEPIAVIGMAVRLPGAADLAAFWELVRTAGSGIEYFEAAPGLVGARSQLDGMFDFDPGHFGVSARDAALMDPQQRHVLMSCVEALAHAGIGDPAAQRVGVLASCGENTYFQAVLRESDPATLPDRFQLALHHDKDFLATKAAYLLGLTGPAFAAQSACGSSLMAVHVAAGLLRQGDADVMLVSGALIDPDLAAGYRYAAQHIFSADGHCRPFSDDAGGTLGASGVATVVLKPLRAARRDGDRVYAVITGSAVNNDGSAKMSYGAPSVAGQRDVIEMALRRSGRTGCDVGYIEAHGTATRLGDPVEVRALRQALDTAGPRQVALSTVKSQLGHLGAAAGVVGLIRAVLSIHHGVLPPTPGFRAPNPEFGPDWEPFYVPTAACPWPTDRARVAGVSSFGIGGTNAHVVLEAEHAFAQVISDVQPALVLSSSSENGLRADALRIADYLGRHPESFDRVLRHLQAGRPARRWRIATVCRNASEAIDWLRQAPAPVRTESSGVTTPSAGNTAAQLVEHWLAGDDIDWSATSAQPPWDFPAPSFDCARFTFDRISDRTPLSERGGAGDARRLAPAEWLRQPTWVRWARAVSTGSSSGRSLVIVTADPLDPATLDTFRTVYDRVVEVRAAARFARTGAQSFDVDPADRRSVATLLEALAGESHTGIDWLHALAGSVVGPVGHDSLRRARWACLDAPAALLQSLDAAAVRPRVLWVSCDARPVDGPVRRPELGLFTGVTEVAPYESDVAGHWLDLPGPDWQACAGALAALLGGEPAALPRQLALRHGYWWEQAVTPVRDAAPGASAGQGLSLSGTHVVLGGTGGIGAAIAAWLLENTGGDVVLVARNCRIPDAVASWPDRVTVVEADLADPDPHAVASLICRHTTRIASVVHAAGAPAGGVIARRDAVAARLATAAKLGGALVAEHLIEQHRPALAVYCSSMASHFGGVGQLDYAAANGALDGFARYHCGTADTTLRIGVNWDIWRETGMAVHTLQSDARHQAHLAVGISTDEGKQVFERSLRLQLPQLFVCTTDLDTARTFYGPAASARDTMPSRYGEDLADLLGAELRTALAVDVVDPQACLYDLGADSLTLLELTDRIKQVRGIDLDLSELSHQVSLAEILGRIADAEDAGHDEDVSVEIWQQGTGRDVLCLIHPVGGDIQSYRALVSALPADLTVCLIADPGLKRTEPARWTLDERARTYYTLLRERFPAHQWDLRLAGWSFGAWVAVGMAAHAEAAEWPVDGLYLIDPPPVDAGAALRHYRPEHLAAVFERELDQSGGRTMSAGARDYAKRLAACCESNLLSMAGHMPPRLRSTRTWVWLAQRTVTDLPFGESGRESVAAWSARLPAHSDLRTIDADHYQIVESPHVRVIAATIAATIGELV